MSNKIQIKRGMLTNLPTLLDGELAYTEDSKGLWVGTPTGTNVQVAGQTLSVKAYGAKGDGTTDDTVALAAAFMALQTAGGGSLYFPPGTYLHSGATLTLNASGVRLYGDGATISTSYNGILLSLGGTSTSSRQSRIVVEGLKFVASTIGTGGQQAVQFNYCREVLVRNCHFQDFGGCGVKANEDCQYVLMDKNTADNIGTIALYVEGSTTNPNAHIWFVNNTVTNFNYGIEAKMASHVVITGNVVETGQVGSVKYGILVTRSYSTGAEPTPQNVIVAHNIVRNAAYQGINLTAVADYEVVGNLVESSGNQAITCSGSRGVCALNIVKNCATGISVNYNSTTAGGTAGVSSTDYASAQATVQGNRVFGTTLGESYSFNGCDESIITFNTAQNPTYAGYAFHFTSCVNTQAVGNTARGGSMTYGFRIETTCTGMTFRDNHAVGYATGHSSVPSGYLGHKASQGFFEEVAVPMVQTTDATATVLFGYTIPQTNSLVCITGTVAVKSSSGSSYRGAWDVKIIAYRTSSSAVIQVSTITVINANDAGLAVTSAASGNDVQIKGTGIAATNLTWIGNLQATKREI